MGISIALVCLLVGFLLQRVPTFPSQKIAQLGTSYLIYLVLPVLALLHLPPLVLSWQLLLPISAAWLTFLCSWALFGSLGKKYGWEKGVTGCLILVAGLANTSFLGFPIIEALYGKAGLATALLIDQGGSFLLASTLSLWIGARYGHVPTSGPSLLLKMVQFPPFVFLLGGILMSGLGLRLPTALLPLFEGIASTMAPVALGVIGLRLHWDKNWLQSRFLWYGLGFRLLLAPALVWGIYAQLMPTSGLVYKVTVLESGMAPMITGALLAAQFGLQPRLASLLAGLGVPLSVLSLLFWYFLLG
jgi:predicted permease